MQTRRSFSAQPSASLSNQHAVASPHAVPPPIHHQPAAAAGMPLATGKGPSLDPVIKVFTTSASPNYSMPWQTKPPKESFGSGFVIEGERILTNAHVVADSTFIMVRKHGLAKKFPARVTAIGHDCDLAVLGVDDPLFWKGVHPLPLGDIPNLQDSVTIVGYPTGGDNISVTAGVVSRVEPQQYAHGSSNLLAVQIDAAINNGNSGGPALRDNKIVGVAFQNLAGAENMGFIIPVPIIRHFLTEIESKTAYRGFPSIGLTLQTIENDYLKRKLNLRPNQGGLLINSVHSIADAARVVFPGDVLLAFDGIEIDGDGTVPFRQRERISFDYLVSQKFAGDTARITLMRDGKQIETEVVVNPLTPLVPPTHYDKPPSYYIYAGLVFTALTQPYLHEWGEDWYDTAPRKLTTLAMDGKVGKPGEQVIILTQVLLDEINMGYQNLVDHQVLKINGEPVFNIAHARKLIEAPLPGNEKHIRIDLMDHRVIFLDKHTSDERNSLILKKYRIPATHNLADTE